MPVDLVGPVDLKESAHFCVSSVGNWMGRSLPPRGLQGRFCHRTTRPDRCRGVGAGPGPHGRRAHVARGGVSQGCLRRLSHGFWAAGQGKVVRQLPYGLPIERYVLVFLLVPKRLPAHMSTKLSGRLTETANEFSVLTMRLPSPCWLSKTIMVVQNERMSGRLTTCMVWRMRNTRTSNDPRRLALEWYTGAREVGCSGAEGKASERNPICTWHRCISGESLSSNVTGKRWTTACSVLKTRNDLRSQATQLFSVNTMRRT